MPMQLSEKITVATAEKYSLSIRLEPDGLSFSFYSKEEQDSFLYYKVAFDKSINYVAALKNFFFENDWLAWFYKKVNIISVTNQYLLVPDVLYDEKKGKELLSSAYLAPQSGHCQNKLDSQSSTLLYAIDEEVYEFCSRSLLNTHFYHHLTPLIHFWNRQRKMSANKRMFVSIFPDMIDIVYMEDGKLLFANSYLCKHSADVIYYILYVWKQLGFDQQKDILILNGEASLLTPVFETTKKYIKMVNLMELPAESYLLGTEVSKAPFDLIALSLCAL